jgi:trimethylamine--corrinoid protein Co-methyltransferase
MMFDLIMNLKKDNENARKRTGGSKARRGEQKNQVIEPYFGSLKQAVKGLNLIDSATLPLVEERALSVLENLGVDFGLDDEVLTILTDAGAEQRDGRIYFPKGMCQKLLANAPRTFTHHARNPKYSLEIGGDTSSFTLSSGAHFVQDLNGDRRQSTQNDLENFIKLAHVSPSVHAQGFTPCQASDIDKRERYLSSLYAHIKYSDKSFSGAVGSRMEALHSVEIAKIVFGEQFLENHQVLLAEVNVQSPLKFEQNVLDVLRVYASSNQASVITSMALLGITCPMSIFDALVQVTAEFFAGAAFTQIVRPGSPVVFGVFSAVASMQTGTLSFSSPEGGQFIQCAGQIARKLGVPFRAVSGITGSKALDSQATLEAHNGLIASISSGANIISCGAGSLEGGLVASYQKFITDSDQLSLLQRRVSSVEFIGFGDSEDTISDGIASGSFLGSRHTKDNFRKFDNGSILSDNSIFEQWNADGAKTSEARANAICKLWLDNYQQPPLDLRIDQALRDFIESKREVCAQMPKSNYSSFKEADCQAIAANHLHDNMWGDVFRQFAR